MRGYADFAFRQLGADAITVHPYMGSEAMAPFIKDPDHGVFVLCRTSNPGGWEMQNFSGECGGAPLFMHVAKTVAETWNANSNCGLVVGATHPRELAVASRLAPRLPLLIPGIGKQGGDLYATIKAAVAREDAGPFVINQSSSFMYQPTIDASVASLRMVNDAVKRVLAEPR